MAPPGRRKGNFMTMLPLLVLCLLAATAHAASAALGIDLGTEYIKAAIAKPGSPIEIVLTKDSKRKEAASLAFKPSRAQLNDKDAYPERLYGGDALALSARYPSDVYVNLKPLLGVPYSDEAVTAFSSRYPGLRTKPVSRKDSQVETVGFDSPNVGQSEPFMVEELLAMELKNIKANAEAAVGKNNFVTDAVITYPAYYTAEEKRAIEQAADLAGFRLLGLMSDGLAVGLNYATNRAFDSVSDGAKPEYHVIYDMGAGSTTATVMKFQGRSVKGPGKRNQNVQEALVVGTGYDRSLGGDALNDFIVQDMISKFLETPAMKKFSLDSIHVRKDGKTMARLWKDAEKLRQVLSANNQASASFEGLFYEDVNFKYKLTRAEFQELAAAYETRIAAPLEAALSMAGLSIAEIDSVILHGGMTRTPFVISKLEAAAGNAKKVKTNVNADEAAAFGAAFKAAGLSPSFRVKEIRTSDISGTAYSMSWIAEGKERQQKIFVETSSTGVEKQIPIKVLEDSSFEFLQAETKRISVAHAINLTKSVDELKTKYGCAVSNISTTLNVRLSQTNGLPEIVSGSVSCKAEQGKDGGVMDGVKGLFGFGKKDQKPLQGDDDDSDPTTQTPLPVDDTTSSGTTVTATPSANATSTSSKKSTSAKPSSDIVNIPLAFKSNVLGYGAPQKERLPAIKARLTAFDTSDRSAVKRAEALNVLEAFTYRARDYVDDETFVSFTTPAIVQELSKKLSETSDWLYGDGTDAKIGEFQERLKKLKALVDPVLKRKDESSKRDKAVDALRSGLTSANSMVDMIKASVERAASDAASAASAAASTASESVSSVIAPDSDDLEDEPYASTIDVGATETGASIPKPYEYSEEDLSTIQKAYDNAKIWLDEKLALQGKLAPHQDPAFLVAELEARAQTLQNTVTDIIMKQINMAKPKKAKTSKSKTKKTKATSTSSTSTTATPTKKDEL